MLNLIYDRTEADVMAGDTPWVPEWQQGNINSGGKDASSTTRVRSIGFYQFNGSILRIYVPEGLKVAARQYSSAAASSFERIVPYPSGWLQGGVLFDVLSNKFYRFIVNRVDNSTLTPSEPALSDITFVLLNEKGRYNYTDLNRVETAVGQLVEMLNSAGWSLSLTTKTDWAAASEAAPAQDIPTASDMARYLGNIAAIRHALAFYRTTPAVPDSMDFLTWQKANAIERILADAEELINNMLAARFYSGEVYAGEV